jgi:hypothetical protein
MVHQHIAEEDLHEVSINLEKAEGTINNEQSRDTGNTGCKKEWRQINQKHEKHNTEN